MEPDEIQRIYESIHTYDIMRTTQDLSRVSTRDLLNECYRRRAIERFSYKASADSYMLKEQPDSQSYIINDVFSGLTSEVRYNTKFFENSVVIKQTVSSASHRTDFLGEFYVCKHPSKVRGS